MILSKEHDCATKKAECLAVGQIWQANLQTSRTHRSSRASRGVAARPARPNALIYHPRTRKLVLMIESPASDGGTRPSVVEGHFESSAGSMRKIFELLKQLERSQQLH
jgi:hypothetical protein